MTTNIDIQPADTSISAPCQINSEQVLLDAAEEGDCLQAEPTPLEQILTRPTCIVVLEGVLQVQRDHFKKWQFNAVQRALGRLRQAGHPTEDKTDGQTILDWHAAVIAGLAPRPKDEAGALETLLAYPTLDVDTARRIRSRAATLADALTALTTRIDLSGQERRSAVTRLARLINRKTGAALDGIPARQRQIDAWLEQFTHADFGIQRTSYEQLKSRVRRVVGLVDGTARRRLAVTLLSPEWAALANEIKEEEEGSKGDSIKGDYAKLNPLIRYCHDHAVAPQEVNDATLEGLQAALLADGCSDPFETSRNVVYAWERLQAALPAFPRQNLARLYRVKDGRARHVKLETLPLAFQADWQAFAVRYAEAPGNTVGSLVSLVVDDGCSVEALDNDLMADICEGDEDDLPELEAAPALDAQISRAYLTNIKSHVVQAAALAVKMGVPSPCLQDVVKPALVEKLLQSKLQKQLAANREHPRKNSTLKNAVTGLLKVARLIGEPDSNLRVLEDLRDKVDPHLKKRSQGTDGTIKREYSEHRMGPRHKKRIQAMANDIALLNWFRMIPVLRQRLEKIIEDGRVPTPEEANDAIVLVLHAITRRCPLRRANLAMITVYGSNPWLQMPVTDGGQARLVIPAAFVKNGVEITVNFPAEIVDIFALYLDHVRPVIASRVGASADNPYLFPAQQKTHRAPETLNEIFTHRNWRIGGFKLNLHCQRHLAGKIILDRDHRQMELVRQLLGHRRLSTTERYYTEVNQVFAQQEFHALLDARYEELLLAHSKRRP